MNGTEWQIIELSPLELLYGMCSGQWNWKYKSRRDCFVYRSSSSLPMQIFHDQTRTWLPLEQFAYVWKEGDIFRGTFPRATHQTWTSLDVLQVQIATTFSMDNQQTTTTTKKTSLPRSLLHALVVMTQKYQYVPEEIQFFPNPDVVRYVGSHLPTEDWFAHATPTQMAYVAAVCVLGIPDFSMLEMVVRTTRPLPMHWLSTPLLDVRSLQHMFQHSFHLPSYVLQQSLVSVEDLLPPCARTHAHWSRLIALVRLVQPKDASEQKSFDPNHESSFLKSIPLDSSSSPDLLDTFEFEDLSEDESPILRSIPIVYIPSRRI